MEYSIKELSDLAGVSARTLRYYDEIGILKPSYVNEAGYRFYRDQEVTLLQQILFYRERGFSLKKTKQILYQDGFDTMSALTEHLRELEEEKERMESLIQTVKQTMSSMKGECNMSDQAKFEAFKKNLVKENEEKNGAEVRERFGDEQMDASNRKILNMAKEEWNQFQDLEKEIIERLEKGVRTQLDPDSIEAKEIVILHKKWLSMTWKQYSAEAHKGLASAYVTDERFRQYYDKEVSGCAELLEKAIGLWADRIS